MKLSPWNSGWNHQNANLKIYCIISKIYYFDSKIYCFNRKIYRFHNKICCQNVYVPFKNSKTLRQYALSFPSTTPNPSSLPRRTPSVNPVSPPWFCCLRIIARRCADYDGKRARVRHISRCYWRDGDALISRTPPLLHALANWRTIAPDTLEVQSFRPGVVFSPHFRRVSQRAPIVAATSLNSIPSMAVHYHPRANFRTKARLGKKARARKLSIWSDVRDMLCRRVNWVSACNASLDFSSSLFFNFLLGFRASIIDASESIIALTSSQLFGNFFSSGPLLFQWGGFICLFLLKFASRRTRGESSKNPEGFRCQET